MRRPQDVRQLKAAAERIQMGAEILPDADFAVGRSQRPDGQPRRPQPFPDFRRLLPRDVCGVLSIYPADFQQGDAVLPHSVDLLGQRAPRLVRKKRPVENA